MSTIGKFTIPWQTLSLNICLLLSLISYNKNRNKNPTWDHRTPSSLVFENNLFCNFIVERNSIVVVATTTPIRMFLKLHTLFTRIALRFTRSQWIGSSKLYCFKAALQSGLKPRPGESGWKICSFKSVRIRVDRASNASQRNVWQVLSRVVHAEMRCPCPWL